jgi:hypothetical protein
LIQSNAQCCLRVVPSATSATRAIDYRGTEGHLVVAVGDVRWFVKATGDALERLLAATWRRPPHGGLPSTDERGR